MPSRRTGVPSVGHTISCTCLLSPGYTGCPAVGRTPGGRTPTSPTGRTPAGLVGCLQLGRLGGATCAASEVLAALIS
jgi:hypothetical protein